MRKIAGVIAVLSLLLLLGSCYKRAVSPVETAAVAAAEKKAFQPDSDSVSAASDTTYFADNSLSVEELYETIHNLSGGALAVATVNADGSPNLAYVGPDMIDDDVLMFGLSDNQTRINIEERKFAVAGVYLYDPEWDGGLADSRGARLVLRLIEDADEIERLKERAPEAPENVLFMKIVRILSVG